MIVECYKILKKIEARPAMFTGAISLESIYCYISGYSQALLDNGIIIEESELESFHDWVANKLGYYESTAGWVNMILAHSLDFNPKEIIWEEFLKVQISKEQHLKSINNFYNLVELFKKEIKLKKL